MLFYIEYSKIGIYYLVAVLIACIILFFSYRFSIYNPDPEKLSPYECGFDPYEDARDVFDVRFYIIAILFLVFDLEAAFFFPWCVSYSFLSFESLLGVVDFVFELFCGFLYAWVIGALDGE